MEKAILKAQINKAIDAHGEWKIRLQETIEKGTGQYTVEDLRNSNLCDFGKWLYLEVDPGLLDGEQYIKVRDLHQAFHNTAADVLSWALLGQKDKARDAMGTGSDYARLSSELIIAMGEWRNSL